MYVCTWIGAAVGRSHTSTAQKQAHKTQCERLNHAPKVAEEDDDVGPALVVLPQLLEGHLFVQSIQFVVTCVVRAKPSIGRRSRTWRPGHPLTYTHPHQQNQPTRHTPTHTHTHTSFPSDARSSGAAPTSSSSCAPEGASLGAAARLLFACVSDVGCGVGVVVRGLSNQSVRQSIGRPVQHHDGRSTSRHNNSKPPRTRCCCRG